MKWNHEFANVVELHTSKVDREIAENHLGAWHMLSDERKNCRNLHRESIVSASELVDLAVLEICMNLKFLILQSNRNFWACPVGKKTRSNQNTPTQMMYHFSFTLPMRKDAHWSCFQSSLQQYQCSRMTLLHQAQQRRLVAGSFIPLGRLFAPASRSHLFPYLKFLTLNPLYWVDQYLDEKTDSVCMEVSAGRNNYELHGISYKPHAQFDGTSLASFGDTSESLSLSLSHTHTHTYTHIHVFPWKCIWSIYNKQWVHSWCGHFSMAVKTLHHFSHKHSYKCPFDVGLEKARRTGTLQLPDDSDNLPNIAIFQVHWAHSSS